MGLINPVFRPDLRTFPAPSVGLLSGSILWLTVPLSSYQLLSSRRLKGRGRRGQTLLPLNRQARLWPGMGVMGQDEEGR
jgi:hypothetical protein